MTATVIPATMGDGKVCLTNFTECKNLQPLTALVLARDLYSGMNCCNILRFFDGEAIFSNYELGSQSCSFLPTTEYFFQ